MGVEVRHREVVVNRDVTARDADQWHSRDCRPGEVSSREHASRWEKAISRKDSTRGMAINRGIVRRIVWNPRGCRRSRRRRAAACRWHLAGSRDSIVIEQIIHRAEQETISLAGHHRYALVERVALAHAVHVRNCSILALRIIRNGLSLESRIAENLVVCAASVSEDVGIGSWANRARTRR